MSHLIMGWESSGLLQGFYLALISREKYSNSWEEQEEAAFGGWNSLKRDSTCKCGRICLDSKMNLFCFSLVSLALVYLTALLSYGCKLEAGDRD